MANRTTRIASLTLTALLALMFLGAGIPKALGVDTPNGSPEDFERWGYPAWFRAIVGVGETLGALLLLAPLTLALLRLPLRVWASLGLAVDMAGAVATHALHAEPGNAVFAAVLLGACIMNAWLATRLANHLSGRQPVLVRGRAESTPRP